MKKRFYSKEFKMNAVRLSYQRANIKELADELGIKVERIYKWRQASRSAKESSLSDESSISITDYKEVSKRLKEKELELEILKKAIYIFSKRDGSTINL